MVKVFQGERTFLHPVLRPVERGIYWVTGIDEEQEQGWKGYLVAMLLVSVVGLVFTYVILRFQNDLPLNPENFPGVPAALAFNTAVSFTTNTNWQNYTGEATMSYLSQMLGLTFHQFLSAATGIALAIATIRGVARHSAQTIGNFYVDIVRCILYVLLPIAVVATIILVASGSIQNLSGYTPVTTLEGVGQTIAQGPVAAMEAIKDLGTNGGGFFNANAAASLREPHRAHQRAGDLPLPGHPLRAGDHLRQVGRQRQAGHRPLRRDGHHPGRRRGLRRPAGAGGQPGASARPAVSQVSQRHPVGRQHGGQGGPLRRPSSPPMYNTATTGTSTGSVDGATGQLHPARRHGPHGAHRAG